MLLIWSWSSMPWHTARNKFNQLPAGNLKHIKDSLFIDSNSDRWILQPHSANIFHQSYEIPLKIELPYPNISNRQFEYDPNHPNLKFLQTDYTGGSKEAILQPNGKWLNAGSKMGTFNYSDPTGFWGTLGHGIFDVLPHIFSSDYDSTEIRHSAPRWEWECKVLQWEHTLSTFF